MKYRDVNVVEKGAEVRSGGDLRMEEERLADCLYSSGGVRQPRVAADGGSSMEGRGNAGVRWWARLRVGSGGRRVELDRLGFARLDKVCVRACVPVCGCQ